MYNNKKIKPFLKWAGGKRWLIGNYPHIFPTNFDKYIEPFLGSGAVFFFLEPKKAILSDANYDLIQTYKSIRKEHRKVWKKLLEHKRNHGHSYYYKVRSSRPRFDLTKSAKFIYLNRTCFNGIYRVNLKGEFNVPKGSKDNFIYPDDDFEKNSEILKHAQLRTNDFTVTINKATNGDFIYVDPPYTVKHNKNNFIKYNEKIFSWKDQIRLSKALKKAAKRGALILISNANHDSIKKLYSDSIWFKNSVNRYSFIASKSQYRKQTSELLISNYEIHVDKGNQEQNMETFKQKQQTEEAATLGNH